MKERVFVSFDEFCPFEYKHCYTYEIERERNRTIDEIVDSISNEVFDIVYVSQKNDNFANPERGLELYEKIFDKYNTNLFIITRNVFNSEQLTRLKSLHSKMLDNKKQLFFAVSLNATTSIEVCENIQNTPSPYKHA